MSGKRKFKTPEAYGKFIQGMRFQEIPMPDAEDMMLREASFERIHQQKFPERDSGVPRYHLVIGLIVERLLEVVSDQQRKILSRLFYFSTIDTTKIDAIVHHSEQENFYAIFINSAFIDLLSKLGKLNLAKQLPDAIGFCNRFPDRAATDRQIEDMRNEYIAWFSSTGHAAGPYLIIKPEYETLHFDTLDIQERFILFHEIGHALNGDCLKIDMERPSDFCFEAEPNLLHRKEYFADMIAMYLVLKTEQHRLTGLRRLQILIALTGLFDTLYLMQAEPTETHPDPISRLFCISDYYFGVQFTDHLNQSYQDKTAMYEMLKLAEQFNSQEKEVAHLFDGCFSEIFMNETPLNKDTHGS